jgi:hypothetical protein
LGPFFDPVDAIDFSLQIWRNILYQITAVEQVFKFYAIRSRPTLSGCWVTSDKGSCFHEMCVGIFTFLSTLEVIPPCHITGQIYLYRDEGRFLLSTQQEFPVRSLTRIRPILLFNLRFVNESFVFPFTNSQASEQFPLVVMVRLFLLRDRDSNWILYMDIDLTVMRPFPSDLMSCVSRNQHVPIWATLARPVPCSGPNRSATLYHSRQKMTIYNTNQNLYFNSGFLLFRNCKNTQQIISRVLEIGATQKQPLPLGDQEMLWAFSNSSLYGILPWTFNCQPGGICNVKCEPGSAVIHGHRVPERTRAEQMFRTNLQL